MITLVDIVLLSVALAMDCFAISIASGVILSRSQGDSFSSVSSALSFMARHLYILRLCVLFGLFQALMPLLGWLATTWLADSIEAYDHWVAFGLLAFLGVRMIRDAFSDDTEQHFDPSRLTTQFLLAVATSIDALAVGISLAMTGYRSLAMLSGPLMAIGVASFVMGMAGHILGISLGARIRRRLKPELLGGIILIVIGVKILVTHLAS